MKWTKDKCQKEALKYKNRNEFKNNNSSAYRLSIKNNWLDDITKHMLKPFEIKLKWTKDKCQEEALKYKTKNIFTLKSRSAYNSALKNNWLNEICSHMKKSNYKQKNYWTKEKCQEEALKYNYRNDFKLKSNVSYNTSLKNNWLNDICVHMKNKYNSANYYTKDKCQKEALKYKNRTNFYKNSPTFYRKSLEYNYMDEICTHMIKYGNSLYRCIYAYEFTDNHVYIGLTYNINKRNKKHLSESNSNVFRHINITKLQPKLIQLTNYVPVNDAIKLEEYFEKKYKKNNWILLNKMKTGGIGGNILKWTFEKCKEEALKYNKRSIFAKKSPSAYSSSNKHKWLNDICTHMSEIRKPNNYWTKDKCQEEALKYNKKIDYYNNSNGSYKSAKRHKWLNEICYHMKQNRLK